MRILDDDDDSDYCSDDGKSVTDKSTSNNQSVFTPIKLHAWILGAQAEISLPVVHKSAKAQKAPRTSVVHFFF